MAKQGKVTWIVAAADTRARFIEEDGFGRSVVLTCPYHRWAYGLDGGLRTTPEFGEVAGFRCDNHGLLPVHVEDWRSQSFRASGR